jgi:protein-tyrosine phosphatase
MVMSEWFDEYGFGQVAPGFWAGAYPTDAEDVAAVAGLRVTRVLNLCEDAEYTTGERTSVDRALADAGIREARIRLVDFGELPEPELDLAVRTVCAWLDAGEQVYLHCRAGWQRSATVAAGVIALREEVGPEEALERLETRRPDASPLPHQRRNLLTWWSARWT